MPSNSTTPPYFAANCCWCSVQNATHCSTSLSSLVITWLMPGFCNSDSCTIDHSKDARCEAQTGRANFGICLIKAKSGGDQSLSGTEDCVDGTELTAAVLSIGAGWWDAKPGLSRWAVTESGSVFEPGHGESGPCLCTVPSRRCNCLVARQTLQTYWPPVTKATLRHDRKPLDWPEAGLDVRSRGRSRT